MSGRPILSLTPKHITMKKLYLTKREQNVYDQLFARGKNTCQTYTSGRIPGSGEVFAFTRVLVVLLRLRQMCDHPCLIASSAEGLELQEYAREVPRARRREVWLLPGVGEEGRRLPFSTKDELLGTIVECCQAHVEGDGLKAEGMLTARVAWSVLESACGGITMKQVGFLIDMASDLLVTWLQGEAATTTSCPLYVSCGIFATTLSVCT